MFDILITNNIYFIYSYLFYELFEERIWLLEDGEWIEIFFLTWVSDCMIDILLRNLLMVLGGTDECKKHTKEDMCVHVCIICI